MKRKRKTDKKQDEPVTSKTITDIWKRLQRIEAQRKTATVIVHPADRAVVRRAVVLLEREGYYVTIKTDDTFVSRGKMFVLRTPGEHDLDVAPYDFSWDDDFDSPTLRPFPDLPPIEDGDTAQRMLNERFLRHEEGR